LVPSFSSSVVSVCLFYCCRSKLMVNLFQAHRPNDHRTQPCPCSGPCKRLRADRLAEKTVPPQRQQYASTRHYKRHRRMAQTIRCTKKLVQRIPSIFSHAFSVTLWASSGSLAPVDWACGWFTTISTVHFVIVSFGLNSIPSYPRRLDIPFCGHGPTFSSGLYVCSSLISQGISVFIYHVVGAVI
jgi:hypothetical protein